MKKVHLFLIALLFMIPSSALAADTVDNTSELVRMSDTCLADIIKSEDQVTINDITPNGKMLEFSTSNQTNDDEIIKNIVEEYNKNVFLGIIGHNVSIDNSITNDQALLDELNARAKYLVEAYRGDLLSAYDFDLTYEQFQINDNRAKVIVSRNIVFQTNFPDRNEIRDTLLKQKEGYILEKTADGEWKLLNVIFDTLGFSNTAMDSLASENNPDAWIDEYSFENLQRDQYEDTKTFTDMVSNDGDIHLEDFVSPTVARSKAYEMVSKGDQEIVALNSYTYSKAKADEYAEMYGDEYNREEYWYFYIGGDCTNFASQAMHYAGMPMSSYWWYTDRFDYSMSWTVVDDLRNYIMNYTLSEGYYQDLPPYPDGVGHEGTIVQFSNGTSWSHSAICRWFYDGWLFVAEHTGAEGDTSWRMMTTDLSNMRSFWIAKG